MTVVSLNILIVLNGILEEIPDGTGDHKTSPFQLLRNPNIKHQKGHFVECHIEHIEGEKNEAMSLHVVGWRTFSGTAILEKRLP